MMSTSSHGPAPRLRIRTPTTRNNEPTLLGLPSELRLLIYEFLFTPSGIIDFKKVKDANEERYMYSSPLSPTQVTPAIGLLRVCRQIHDEATSVLYENEFRFYLNAPLEFRVNLHTFLKEIGHNNATKLRQTTTVIANLCDCPLQGTDPSTNWVRWDAYWVIRSKWDFPKCNFRIVAATEEIFCVHTPRPSSPVAFFDIARIAMTKDVLCKEAFLKKCDKFKLLKGVPLARDGLSGHLLFGFAEKHVLWKQRFVVDAENPDQVIFHGPKTATLLNLPNRVLRRILGLVLGPPQDVDVTSKYRPALPRGLMACKGLATPALGLFYAQHTFTFRIEFIKEVKVRTFSLDPVNDWLNKASHRPTVGEIKLILQFKRNVPLERVRINTRPLQELQERCQSTSLKICFAVRGGQHLISFDEIRLNIVRLRKRNLCPDTTAGGYPVDEQLDCMVDGYGEARKLAVRRAVPLEMESSDLDALGDMISFPDEPSKRRNK